jgi:AmiR/NasT family two-component response regulator
MARSSDPESTERPDAEAINQDAHIAAMQAEAIVRDERIAELVAEVEGLRLAISHRSVIEQAKGVIMTTMHCGADAAFAVLVAQSQNENRKLWEVATELARAQDRFER